MSNTTHFGFQTIDEQQKQSRVRGVFDAVAGKYDVMNDVMSAGLHRYWKREMVAALAPQAGQHILDMAGGTGDIASRIRKVADCRITICDINVTMLNEGINRAIDRNECDGLQWVGGNAESLPFPDNHFDACTIAFGIRNVTHIDKALAEIYRVLKIGGRFLCLEFSHMPNATLRRLYDAYSFNVIPTLGQTITGDRAAYQYLVESIRKFPTQQAFVRHMALAGFGNVQYRNMTGGVVALHSGRKL